MKQTRTWKLRGSLLALAIFVTAAGVAGPALADEHHWRGDRDEHHWRGHRDWDRGGSVYVGPSYGYYYDGYYAYPPPAVVYPQPGVGFSINIR